ncbi:MAG: 1,4-dihydroxy-2-naphthoate octaprenyltransferase, partial [Cytophagaceae bacterium]
AAVKYTAGKNPYGYSGLGDVSVFFFFGLTGVLGSFYLYTQQISIIGILPALSIGFFSTGVLNVNNMRDIDSDAPAGKLTIPVKIGFKHAKYYHLFLVVGGLLSILIYSLLTFNSLWQYLHLLSFPLFIYHLIKVFSVKEKKCLDPFLKQLAIATFIMVLLFGLGISSLFQRFIN